MLCFSDNVIADITNKLQDVRNPLAAMNILLRELDLEAELDTPDTALSRTGERSLSQPPHPHPPLFCFVFYHMSGALWSLRLGLKLHLVM